MYLVRFFVFLLCVGIFACVFFACVLGFPGPMHRLAVSRNPGTKRVTVYLFRKLPRKATATPPALKVRPPPLPLRRLKRSRRILRNRKRNRTRNRTRNQTRILRLRNRVRVRGLGGFFGVACVSPMGYHFAHEPFQYARIQYAVCQVYDYDYHIIFFAREQMAYSHEEGYQWFNHYANSGIGSATHAIIIYIRI